MKKSKLIATLCTLVLTLACLTFGVYSAVKTSFTASGTITFNAYNLDVDAKVTITGTEETYEPKYLTSNSDRTEHIWTGVTYSPMTSFSLSNLTFDELGEHQNLINIHFEFVNYSNYQVEAIAKTTTSGSAWDSVGNASKLLYQPTMQTLMDSVKNTSQNTSGFSIMFTPKGQQITGTAENMSIAVTLKPAEREYTIEANGFDEDYWPFDGAEFDRLNYNNLAYAIKSNTTASVGFDETTTETDLPNTYPIPTKIFGHTVDELYRYSFNREERLGEFLIESPIEYMMIPESVKTIGDNSFCIDRNMHTVCLSSGLQEIGYYAFQECSLLNNITIPSTVTSIGYSAFSSCDSLTTITIPDSVTSIGNGAFGSCSSLTTITIPDSVTRIGSGAFDYCPDSLFTTKNGAKYLTDTAGKKILCKAENKSITSCTIDSATRLICSGAFYGCSSLTTITIPESVTSIGNGAFSGCSSLTTILVESGNTKYDSRDNCNAIIDQETNTLIAGCKNTIIPNSVTSIGGDAFNGCSSLTTIEIPASVTSIGYDAFYGCTQLTGQSINSEDNVKYLGYTDDNDNFVPTVVYKVTDNTALSGRYTIPTTCKVICYDAFDGCRSLTTITIPASVTSIGDRAFSSCRSLTTITIPASVTSIGDRAFQSCSNLTTITIPEGVTSIGEMAFYNCSRLTRITCNSSNVGTNSIGVSMYFKANDSSTLPTSRVSKWQAGAGVYTKTKPTA